MTSGKTPKALLVAMVASLAACSSGSPAASPAEPSASTTEFVTPSQAASLTASGSPTAMPVPTPAPLTSEALRELVTVAGVREHLEALQGIADHNGGNRATGTSGFDATVDYVEQRLSAAGYEVERQDFAVGDVSSTTLLVETGGPGDEVAMFGAHLDSVPAGPGINDNGSGVAALLVVAERMAERAPPNRPLRFAFWGAEEGGTHGSAAYVSRLTDAERDRIGAYVNFDMLGSPNFIRFVYADAGAAPGSDRLVAMFGDYFDDQGLAWESIDLTGHADHGAFMAAGVPTSGLFSGGAEAKTDLQAAAFGGTAGAFADACSHLACDTIANLSDFALDQMADAVAHAVATLGARPAD